MCDVSSRCRREIKIIVLCVELPLYYLPTSVSITCLSYYHLLQPNNTLSLISKANVDHALINFMLDWFPKEAQEKDKANKKESTMEEMEGLDLDIRCITM